MSSQALLRDNALAADVRECLESHVALRHTDISVTVHGGVAHAWGCVNSIAEREMMRHVIARVRGIHAVWDVLRVGKDGFPRILDIGCGDRKQVRDAIGVDYHRHAAVDVMAHIERGLPFRDGTIDQVYAVHFLKHVNELLPVMNEIHRVLKAGGVLHVMVPHWQYVNAVADPTHRRLFNRQTFKFFCRPYPNLRLFRPLSISETHEDLFADLQPIKSGEPPNSETVLARFFA